MSAYVLDQFASLLCKHECCVSMCVFACRVSVFAAVCVCLCCLCACFVRLLCMRSKIVRATLFWLVLNNKFIFLKTWGIS